MAPDPYAWSWNPEALIVVPAMAVAYGLALRRHPASAWRIGAFATGLLLVLGVTVTPVETLSLEYLLTVHLLQNVVLAEWAPLLVVAGLPPALAARATRLRALRALTRPLVALPLWLVSYFAWHLPPVYDAALRHPHSLLHLEHASYFVTGVLLWWCVVHDEPHRLSSGARAGYVFAAFLLASPIGLLMALLPEAAYEFYVDAPRRLWGLTPLEDQQIAGLTMAAEQAVGFFAAFAWFFARFLREQDEEP